MAWLVRLIQRQHQHHPRFLQSSRVMCAPPQGGEGMKWRGKERNEGPRSSSRRNASPFQQTMNRLAWGGAACMKSELTCRISICLNITIFKKGIAKGKSQFYHEDFLSWDRNFQIEAEMRFGSMKFKCFLIPSWHRSCKSHSARSSLVCGCDAPLEEG